MPDFIDSSAEINRIELIGACTACLNAIIAGRRQKHREREEATERAVTEIMNRRFNWLGRPVTITRERSLEMVISQRDDIKWRFEDPDLLYQEQEKVAEELRTLCRASDADTVRVTRKDFARISDFFRR